MRRPYDQRHDHALPARRESARRHVLRRAAAGQGLHDRIRAALAELRPLLRIEQADLELVNFDGASGVAVLRVEGDCPDCEMSVSMMMEGISAHLRSRVPEIREVRRLGV